MGQEWAFLEVGQHEKKSRKELARPILREDVLFGCREEEERGISNGGNRIGEGLSQTGMATGAENGGSEFLRWGKAAR